MTRGRRTRRLASASPWATPSYYEILFSSPPTCPRLQTARYTIFFSLTVITSQIYPEKLYSEDNRFSAFVFLGFHDSHCPGGISYLVKIMEKHQVFDVSLLGRSNTAFTRPGTCLVHLWGKNYPWNNITVPYQHTKRRRFTDEWEIGPCGRGGTVWANVVIGVFVGQVGRTSGSYQDRPEADGWDGRLTHSAAPHPPYSLLN